MSDERKGMPLRPRLWVPGVAYVDGERRLQVGRQVGYSGRGEAFRHGPCGRAGGLAEWRHRAWLLERAKLTAAIVAEEGLILPEKLVDAEVQPHARRWLIGQPLICVSGQKWQRLCARGLRLYCVEHGVEQPGWLSVRAAGGGRNGWTLAGPLEAFWSGQARDQAARDGDMLAAERDDVRATIDRLLTFVTGSVLTEAGVDQALGARSLVDPGYGYHGATDGVAASLEAIARALRPLEALFAQIYERAESMGDEARELRRCIESAAPGIDDVAVPIYGSARCDALPELRLDLGDGAEPAEDGSRWLVGEQRRAELVLPPWPRWTVERVQPWSPELPAVLGRELDRARERRTARSVAGDAVVGLALLLLVAAALMWWLW